MVCVPVCRLSAGCRAEATPGSRARGGLLDRDHRDGGYPSTHRLELMSFVSLKSFSVRYPKFVLQPLDLEFSLGERIAIVGANGAGKSTMLRAIGGRWREYQGRVEIGGREVRSQLPGIRAEIGFLPERPLGLGWMTVGDHLDFLSAFFPTWDVGYQEELLRRLALPTDRKLGNLSKGMAVKLALVAAEAHRPSLLILDEPTSGIDPLMRGELIDLVKEAAPAGGDRLVLFSSHILEDVERIADRVILLREGKLINDLAVDDLRNQDHGKPLSQLLYSALSYDATTIHS